MNNRLQTVLRFQGTDYCEKCATEKGIGSLYQATKQFPGVMITTLRESTCDVCTVPFTPEEAWQKVTVLSGMYARRYDMPAERSAAKNKSARYQMYKILGAAGIRMSDEVKDKVWDIMQVAAQMESEWQNDEAYQLPYQGW